MADPTAPELTRRRFLGGAVVLLCAAPLGAAAGCKAADSGDAPQEDLGPWNLPEGTTLSRGRFATLAAMLDALIPGDASSPGAEEAHAAFYLDQLFGAFREDPPRIFAGGPYSGRHGGNDDFSHFQRLTRVEEIRWRTYIEGSRGIPEREFNGPVTGIVRRYEDGLDALDQHAQDSFGTRFAKLDGETRRTLLKTSDPEFLQTAYEHAVEGTYGDPVYGGNFERSGWRAIDYEGDRQPIGFTANQMLHPEEG